MLETCFSIQAICSGKSARGMLGGGLVDYSTQLMLGGGLVRKEAVK